MRVPAVLLQQKPDTARVVTEAVPHTAKEWLGVLPEVALDFVAAAVAWWAVSFLASRVEQLAARSAARHGGGQQGREQRARTVSHLLANAGHIVIVVVTVLALLGTLGLDITPFVASAGIVGLAISFGSQNLVKDYVTGFFLQIEHQFDVGDVIRVAGHEGVVEDVALRVIHLRDADGTLHIIPNGAISQLSNLSRSWARSSVDVEVKWDEVDRAVEALRQAADEMARDERWADAFQGPPQVVGIEKLAQGTVTMRVSARVDPRRRNDVERELRARVLRALAQMRAEQGAREQGT